MKKKQTRIIQIAASNLAFDRRYQRDLIPARVKALAEKLDLDALGIITVAKRKDGTYVVMDGQHRVSAVLHHGFGEWKIKCNVYEGLTLEEEAELFRQLNNTRRITPFDDYRAGMVEGDQMWVDIDAAVRASGLEIQQHQTDGAINCVSTLKRIYAAANGIPGDKLITDTLHTCLAAWGVAATSVESKIVEGISIVLATYTDELDRPAFVKKLSKHKGGAPGLLGQAKVLKEIRGGTLGRMVASTAVDLYNKGRSVEKLPAL